MEEMKIIHGEVILNQVLVIPDNAKKLDIKDGYVVIGESETLMNDHRVAVNKDVEVYEANGTLYIKNDSPTTVYCPNKIRHDEIMLPDAVWKVNIAQEYDYLTQEKRNVAD